MLFTPTVMTFRKFFSEPEEGVVRGQSIRLGLRVLAQALLELLFAGCRTEIEACVMPNMFTVLNDATRGQYSTHSLCRANLANDRPDKIANIY
jgi:hypothetical protein